MTASDFHPVLNQLRGLLGADRVLTQGDLSAWCVDWRKRYQGHPLAVVLPDTTDEVMAVVQLCQQHQVPIVPQGGNTGLVGGGVPDASGTQIVLSLRRLNRVRSVDTANLTMEVEAGCTLLDVQHAAQHAGLLFPLSLASEGSCTIGGNLATNAGGTQVLRYGNARDLCLGLEVVTPQGQVWSGLTGLRKDNTGYDLRHVFVGSEGTLGIITAATLKLFPQPRTQLTAWARCHTITDTVTLLQTAQAQLGPLLTGFEVMNAYSLSLVRQHFPSLHIPFSDDEQIGTWDVLLDVSDMDDEAHAQRRLSDALSVAIERGCVVDAVVAQSYAQAQQLWHVRECIPLAQAQEGLNIKHDISLPISHIPDFVTTMQIEIEAAYPGARLVTFGHLGDGNLHYNVQAPADASAQDFLTTHEVSLNQRVYDRVMALGGSFSAEHGIGALKVDELLQRKSPVALDLMRSLKNAWDPHHLMNPGRLLA